MILVGCPVDQLAAFTKNVSVFKHVSLNACSRKGLENTEEWTRPNNQKNNKRLPSTDLVLSLPIAFGSYNSLVSELG